MVELADETGHSHWYHRNHRWHLAAHCAVHRLRNCMTSMEWIGRTLNLRMQHILRRMNFKCKAVSAFCTVSSSQAS